MLAKLSRFLNILIAAFSGVFLGHSLHVFWAYRAHPELYAMQSAPWYTSILVYGACTAVIVLIALVLKLVIRRHQDRRADDL